MQTIKEDDLYSGYSAGDVVQGVAGSDYGGSEAPSAFMRSSQQQFLGSTTGSVAGLGSTFGSAAGSLIAPMRASTPSLVGGRPGTTSVVPGTAGFRVGTASIDVDARPMTSNKGAGYSSGSRGRFNPLGDSARGSAGSLARKLEASPEEQCRDAEIRVHLALEESAQALAKGNPTAALEKAKEAGKRERAVTALREQLSLLDSANVDLTFAVTLNLAAAYQANQLHTEALNIYTQVVKSKSFPQGGRLRVNMGNIYFAQRKFPAAIKMYRMALDQLPSSSRWARGRVMRNIGTAFVRMGQYQDAMQAFEGILEAAPDMDAAFDLLLCYFALGDRERMRKGFLQLVQVPPYEMDDEDDEGGAVLDGPAEMVSDALSEELRSRQKVLHRYILTAARLIAPVIERGAGGAGFDWCIERLLAAGYAKLANEVALAKASMFLGSQDFTRAVAVLKEFERKEVRLKSRAATNLAFVYLLEDDVTNAARYADLAVAADRYSAQALVNKGAVAAAQGDWEKARGLSGEAANVEADCFEAIYNMGLADKELGALDDALAAFKKLAARLPDNTELMFQVADTLERQGDTRHAIEWLERLHGRQPHDPGVLARLGALHAKLEDDAEAHRYFQESHRICPSNLDVISWLGAFHVRGEAYEAAMPYFELAARLAPQEAKWQLMVASCLRRTGNFNQALEKYKETHALHPLNLECLKYIVHICTELGLKDEVQQYTVKLQRAERSAHDSQLAHSDSFNTRSSSGQARGPAALTRPGSGRVYDSEAPAFLPPATKGKKAVVRSTRDEDEWGEDAGAELLPL